MAWAPTATVVAPVTCPDKPTTAPLALVPTLAWSNNLFAKPGVTATGATTASDTLATIGAVAGIAGTGLGIYHGWRRTGSVGWTLGWGLFGGLLPIVAIPWMFAQGFAKPAGSREGEETITNRFRGSTDPLTASTCANLRFEIETPTSDPPR